MNSEFWKVMFFYALLSCVVGPLIGNHFKGKEGVSQGYLFGTALSVGLWLTVGKKYANM